MVRMGMKVASHDIELHDSMDVNSAAGFSPPSQFGCAGIWPKSFPVGAWRSVMHANEPPDKDHVSQVDLILFSLPSAARTADTWPFLK